MELKRYELVSEDAFGQVWEWNTVADFDGVIDLLAGDKSTDNMKVKEESTHILLVFGDEDIRFEDRVTDGVHEYDVLYVDNPLGMGHHLEIELKRR